ncbi:sigma factor [Daejeonella sp.]|uniref:sigma factor n=1 Tax=Daejeonella sp. TaxID=2805397 RepID=UPI0030C1D906
MTKYIKDRSSVKLNISDDRSEYSLLYDSYAPLLYGVIFRIVKDQVAAERLLEKTILKIWKCRAAHDAKKLTFSTWMINIARNFAIFDSINKNNEATGSAGILELVMTHGLNIKEAAGRLRISMKEAVTRLREELKQTRPLKIG